MKTGSINIIFTRPAWPNFYKFFLALFLLGTVSPLLFAADEFETIKLSDGTSLVLNGVGKVKQLSDDYYYGALYLNRPEHDIDKIIRLNTPKRMQIRIAYKNISARRFGQYWKEAIAINNPRNIWEPHIKSILGFTRFFNQTLIKGDRIDLDFLPEHGTMVYLNGVLLGEISFLDDVLLGKKQSAAFYNLLLMTWVGDRAPNPEFKKAILGYLMINNTDLAVQLQQEFLSLQPTAERIKQVAEAQKKIENNIPGLKLAGNKKKKRPKTKSSSKKKSSAKKNVVKATKKTGAVKKSTTGTKKSTLKKPKKNASGSKPKDSKAKGSKTASTRKIASKGVSSINNAATKIPVATKITSVKTAVGSKAPAKEDGEVTAKNQNKLPSEGQDSQASREKVTEQPVKLSAAQRLKLFEARTEYGKLLRRKIRQHQFFPMRKLIRVRKYRKLMERGQMKAEGTLWVKIARDGSVLSTRMEESTHNSILDDAAIEMVEKADPLPPMPPILEGNDFEFLVKIAFLSPQ